MNFLNFSGGGPFGLFLFSKDIELLPLPEKEAIINRNPRIINSGIMEQEPPRHEQVILKLHQVFREHHLC